MRIAIVHDYLTQRGGAERVVLSMARAFPSASLITALYEPNETYPEFREYAIETLPINRLRVIRRYHRAGLPLFPLMFGRLVVDADVVICSSSGWAHGVKVTGKKLVYCHNPPRWLYQSDDYLLHSGRTHRLALKALAPPLRRWDAAAADTADVYLANSKSVAHRVTRAYGRAAEVLPPPVTIDITGVCDPVRGITSPFLLAVSRLLPYKGVDRALAACAALDMRLVVVGTGPDYPRLQQLARTDLVTFIKAASESELRWLYANCEALVATGREDFGLTPLEANSFGKPVVAVAEGGYLETVRDGETGILARDASTDVLADAIARCTRQHWSSESIKAHARQFSEEIFIESLRSRVAALFNLV